MNLKQAVVFSILMENNKGINTKHPNYVLEKAGACERLLNPEILLDAQNLGKLKFYNELWHAKMEVEG